MKRKNHNASVPEIHKFGGASLADADAMVRALSIVKNVSPVPAVVVVSAMAGVTDALLAMAGKAAAGEKRESDILIQDLRKRHLAAARMLVCPHKKSDQLAKLIEDHFRELEEIAHGLLILRELTPRTNDYILARGEMLSSLLFAAALESSGRQARNVSALEIIKTDGVFGGAFPDLALTDSAARAVLRPLLSAGITPVVPGFIGATPDGQIATMGRGGSDLTAVTLGRALKAREVFLWKDVPGFLTADPKVVADARVLSQLNAREAAELAYYGARVLHPRALIPTFGRALRVYVRPFADPSSKGTEISSRRTLLRHPVKALSAICGQALVNVTGSGMFGVSGIAARTFTALQREGISVSMISQASSEHSICVCVSADSAARAKAALEREFREEIRRRDIDCVDARPNVASLAVVGLGMAGVPGVAARVFSALASGGVLRYRCMASRRRVRVGLTVVDTSSSSGSLSGTDNQFAFTTARYKTSPLVISGPGAGPAVTAAGVLNDVLRLAQ